jgi:outer membrane assembly lipoprotein YfgL
MRMAMGWKNRWMRLCLASLALVLAACASTDRPKPSPLVANPASMAVRLLWSKAIGPVGFPLDVRVVAGKVMVAASNGTVAALEPESGADIWRTNVGGTLSAGVGSDGRFSAVVNTENELVVLENSTVIWRQRLNGLTVTAPLVAGARVFTLSTDRSVAAFDVVSGRKLWQQQRSGDSLVLRQPGLMLAVGDTLVVGLGGRLVGMNPLNGSSRWEVPIATGRGTNEVERLVDLVGGYSRLGDQVCVRSFQSAVACVDAATGRSLWSRPATGSTGLQGDATTLFGTESDSKLLAWKRSDGERLWITDQYKYRALTAPALAGRTLVVGDEAGWVHFLSRADATPLNRVQTDGSPIAVAPVVVGNSVVVVTSKGGVFGFQTE